MYRAFLLFCKITNKSTITINLWNYGVVIYKLNVIERLLVILQNKKKEID